MLKRLKSLFMWIGIILTILVAWKAYDEYRFYHNHLRAMELLGEPEKPNVVFDEDGTMRGKGFVIRP